MVIGKSISVAREAEESQLRLQGVLNATGNAVGLTFSEIDTASRDLGIATLTSANAARDAASALLAFKSIQGETFKETLKLAQDASAVFGGDLRSNVVRLGRALQDPADGLNTLKRISVEFTKSQKELIKGFVESGQAAEAQKIILQEVSESIGGSAAKAAQGLTGSLDTLGERFNALFEVIGQTPAVMNTAIGGVNLLSGAIESLSNSLSDDVQTRLASVRREIELTQEALSKPALALSLGGEGSTGTSQAKLNELLIEQEDLIERAREESREKSLAAINARKSAEEAAAQAQLEAEDQKKASVDEVIAGLNKELDLLGATNAERKTAALLAGKAKDASAEQIAAISQISEQIEGKKKQSADSAKAAAEVERQIKAREKLIQTVTAQANQSFALAQAELQGEDAVKAVNNAIEIENALKAVGLTLSDEQGEAIAAEIKARQELEQQIDATREKRDREAEALKNSQLAPRFDPIQSLGAVGTDLEFANAIPNAQEAARLAKDQAEVFTAPLEAAITNLQSLSVDVLRDIRTGSLESAEDLAGRIGDIFATVPEQAIAGLLSAPIQELQVELSNSVSEALKSGSLDGIGEAFNNPLGAAGLGAAGGGLLVQATGGNQQFGSLGGALGAGAGQFFGGPLGGLVGGLAGSLVGGLIGGGQAKNSANATVNFGSGQITQDNSPGFDDPNRIAVVRLAEELNSFTSVTQSLGVQSSRDNLSLRVSRNRGANESERIVTTLLRESLEADSPIIARAIANSTANSLDELLSDITFAQSIQDMVDGTGQFELALRELDRQFDESARRASNLGLSEAALRDARQDAIDNLLTDAENSVFGAQDRLRAAFESQLTPISSALESLTFGPGTAVNAQDRLKLLQDQFAEQQSSFDAGTLTDTTQLAQTAQSLVGAAREVFGSSGGFQEIFKETNSTLLAAQTELANRQEDAFASVGGEIVRSQESQTDRIVDELRELRDEFDRLKRAVA